MKFNDLRIVLLFSGLMLGSTSIASLASPKKLAEKFGVKRVPASDEDFFFKGKEYVLWCNMNDDGINSESGSQISNIIIYKDKSAYAVLLNMKRAASGTGNDNVEASFEKIEFDQANHIYTGQGFSLKLTKHLKNLDSSVASSWQGVATIKFADALKIDGKIENTTPMGCGLRNGF